MKNKFKKYFYSRSSFLWLFLTIITSLLFGLDLSKNGVFSTWIGKTYTLQFIVLILFIFGSIYFVKNCLRKQKIHNQPSWVYYLFWGILWTVPLTLYSLFKFSLHLFTSTRSNFIFFDIYFLILLFGNLYYRKVKPKNFDCNFRFSPNSVGLDEDRFQYKNSAQNIAHSIYLLNDYVNVISLHGGTGHGKSSYMRMIIESLDKNKILYSYISLTETNEGKSFAKLFSERWNEARTARYPKLLVAEYLPLMRLIFRETGQNSLFEIINSISKYNCGLIKTKAKTYDKYTTHKNNFVGSPIAKLFGNVGEINEDFWIIVIDELERSPVLEIFKVVEMVERFKSEGQKGLPIKIVFFLCIGDNFEGLMNIQEDKELRYLVSRFIDNNSKNIKYRLFLPPILDNQKKDFIFQLISKFKKTNKIQGLPKNREDIEWGYFDPFKQEPLSEIESIKFTVDILANESPRLIKDCFLGRDAKLS